RWKRSRRAWIVSLREAWRSTASRCGGRYCVTAQLSDHLLDGLRVMPEFNDDALGQMDGGRRRGGLGDPHGLEGGRRDRQLGRGFRLTAPALGGPPIAGRLLG